jgi:hypothetical protein
MKRWSKRALIPLLLALTATGCGQTNPVKGRVLLDGQPVAGATVTFLPDADGQGRPASGTTDSDGYFQLMTYRSGDGAPPGTYRIVVSKTEAPAAPPDNDHASKQRAQDYLARHKGRKSNKSLIPAVYSDAAKTPLRCTVPASGLVTVELSSGGNR